MNRLSAVDAGFLQAEDSDRHVSLALGAVAVIDGPMPDYGELVSHLGARVDAIPRLRQVVRVSPADLRAPQWVDDSRFDLIHHVHHAALPHPGDDDALFQFAAEAMQTRLDRDRPLWQCWIIEGLADGRWAILVKIHHCVADGIATMHLLAGFSDDGDPDTFVPRIRAAHQSFQPVLQLPSITLDPRRWVRGVWRAASTVTDVAVRAAEGAGQLVHGLVFPGPPSPLAGPVTALRRYSAVQIDMDDVAQVCKVFGVTVNDVALAAITESYRAALIRRGEPPMPNSMRVLVPVSVRAEAAPDATGNQVSVMIPQLPVHLSDPVEQLRAVHRQLVAAKNSGQRQAASGLVGAAKLIPFPFTAWTVRALFRMPQRGIVSVATNVPGPRQRLTVMGRNVVRLMPIPPVALRLRTGVAILSYADQLEVGVIGDLDAVPDVDEIASRIGVGVHRLVAAARSGQKTTRPLALVHSCEQCQ